MEHRLRRKWFENKNFCMEVEKLACTGRFIPGFTAERCHLPYLCTNLNSVSDLSLKAKLIIHFQFISSIIGQENV